ncbi:peptidoglycan editing factor PgeF [Croceicoccus ponticola]|uniref:Purine nucleoside phosphorylase n=1 Tax=Croceicoccus ponticola TaxID=2217664 RepID=A0A437GX66_9SPHN|nr:peptidoglycan editing factor PgeF [Croceicoccus ponticola]RVQ66959.1 peptidoglycan editing factor PgeF [Croceicoccus ponticola]
MPDIVRSAAIAGMPHGFLGRRGGVSTGEYAGLNVGTGSDDLPRAVEANRSIAADAVLPGADLATVYQVHSADVVRIETPFPLDARPHADAMVTNRPGTLLGILTADCAPVLLADEQAGVIGAAHAGWRGAFAGVCGNTVAAMEKLGADRARIAAAIGPCIAQSSYEVDEGFYLRFLAEQDAFERFFKPGRSGHHQFDLAAFVAASLVDAGVTRVEITGQDTYADDTRYFSYRRATQAGESGYGRQISLIGLPL